MAVRPYTPARASSFRKWYSKPENRQRCLDKQKRWRESPDGARVAFEGHLKKKGISVQEWATDWNDSGGRCRGCLSTLDGGQHTHADHCHVTGVFRGLLCSGCNHAVGKAKDSPEILRRLADYLERNRG